MNAEFALSALPSLFAACLVLIAGSLLADRVPVLARYNIPAPIVGGLAFAVLALILQKFAGSRITLETSARSPLLLVFFATVGLTADIGLLRSGGKRLLKFIATLFPFLVAQNLLGILLAKLLGLHPAIGLLAGSITLVGGHGTGAAYAERFAQDYNLLGVMGLTMTSATLGLVLGGIIGGPVVGRIVQRFGLASAVPAAQGGVAVGPVSAPTTTYDVMMALAAALAAVIAGEFVAGLLAGTGVTVPSFLWCLLIGLALRNGGAALGLRLPDAATNLIGACCLSLFLVWTMMTLDIKAVIELAGPLLVILAAQTVLVVIWARRVVFRAVGGDYEAAVVAGAFCGFAMGATATAIANMQAVARRHGPAPEAFVIVPIVGAFFVDLLNLAVLTIFLLPGFIRGL